MNAKTTMATCSTKADNKAGSNITAMSLMTFNTSTSYVTQRKQGNRWQD